MANQQLINYVNQSRRAGETDERIRQTLTLSGWSASDIQDAMGYDLIKRRKLLYRIGFILLLVFVLILITTFIFRFLNGSKNQNQKTKINNQAINQTNSPADQFASNPNIDRVKIILEDIKQGFLTGDSSLVMKHATAQSTSILSISKLKSVSSFTINSVSQEGSDIIANVTNGAETQYMVFVQENGDWQFDLKATILKTNERKREIGDPNSLPDLVVTKVVVFPNHPIVNSKDVQIAVAIKNAGTKTWDDHFLNDGGSWVSVIVNLIGFSGAASDNHTGLVIAPGETTTLTFNPYKNNDFFKISDTPGQKTIQIVLNKDRKIIESNYDNNVFTQLVQMYSN